MVVRHFGVRSKENGSKCHPTTVVVVVGFFFFLTGHNGALVGKHPDQLLQQFGLFFVFTARLAATGFLLLLLAVLTRTTRPCILWLPSVTMVAALGIMRIPFIHGRNQAFRDDIGLIPGPNLLLLL